MGRVFGELEDAPSPKQFDALDTAGLAGLRAFWRERWGPPPPRLRSPQLLRLLIAWRLQAPAYGSLDKQTKRLLKDRSPTLPLPPGARLTREYLGVLHEVEVSPTGYLYRDRQFRSLSEVARAITGTRWNGPKFFGLREPGQ